ncbi:hypothetical protein OA501_02020 [Flavobacteriaceae bacterium]|nr:hypothetical protein [Flavobacteriaceae bacterium]
MDKYRALVADLLEYDEVSELNMTIAMKDIDEWDSLSLLGFLAMVEHEYSIVIGTSDLDVNKSFEVFYDEYIAK